jgi:hypothetical protein
MNFRQFIEQNTVGKHNDYATSAFLPSVYTGTESPDIHIPHLSSIDLAIPTITKTSFIIKIESNKNPIKILLKDGTKIFLDFDQYNRITPRPEINKKIVVTFQRSSEDNSNNPSKIEKIEII